MATHGIATQHKEGLSNGMLGFILFLASEVMFFGGLFAAYFIARADATEWPPENMLTAEQIARGVKLEVEFTLPFYCDDPAGAQFGDDPFGVVGHPKGRSHGLDPVAGW